MAGMRLRLRRADSESRLDEALAEPEPAPHLPDGWRRPRRSGRGTTIGTLDGVGRSLVDPAGLVTLPGASWSLDWWIGAEDRWHLPAEEVAVRQRLQSSAPVVETRLRVPSGDAVQRAYGARSATGDDVVVIEVENQSKVPFAVALAVRPATDAGRGRIATIGLEGTTVRVDGAVALVLPRSPGRATLATGADGDAAVIVLAGAANTVRAGSVDCGDGLANAALLFPLAHAATLRVVLPLSGRAVSPDEVPGPADVASGWRRQVERGARIEVPDRRLRDAVAASARHLLLAEPSPTVAKGLDLLGFDEAAAAALGATVLAHGASPAAPGAALAALGRHWDLTHDLAFALEAIDAVGALVAGLAAAEPAQQALGHAALGAVARLLDAAGQPRAATDVRRLVARAGDDGAVASLADRLREASSTWTWPGPGAAHEPAANAEVVAAVRELLVTEADDGLSLSPTVPEPWLGQGWELHDLPTRHGRLSFAVRWHGERPALLWQLEPHADTSAVVVRLSVPGLDPSWSTTEPTGEALLAPVALPEPAPRRGLTLPVTIEPLHRGAS